MAANDEGDGEGLFVARRKIFWQTGEAQGGLGESCEEGANRADLAEPQLREVTAGSLASPFLCAYVTALSRWPPIDGPI